MRRIELTHAPAAGGASRLERWLARKLLRAAGDPPLALALWNGESIHPPGAAPVARLRIGDRGAFYRLLAHPDLYFGELYTARRLTVDGDLRTFLELLYRTASSTVAQGWLGRSLAWLTYRPRTNDLLAARDNIHRHYDLGNDFYALWLDSEALQYTCAYYPEPQLTLEQAQAAKLRHICRKLRLAPGERVVEAGAGWGGLACHMALNHGVRVRAYNTSADQVGYARARAAALNLGDRVEFIEDDYRNITGEFDVFVSVGMLEHVGRDHYRELGRVIDRCLSGSGRGLVHFIGRNRPGPMNAWIEKRIFPGAYAPTLGEVSAVFEPWELSILDVENLRLHYARTVEQWLERFERSAWQVGERFDDAFVRAWRLYLTGSIVAFTTGWLQLFQIVFARPQVNDQPWSRAHLYTETDP